MKQKYLISKNQETSELSVREYTELEKGELAFICEELYGSDEIRAAISGGEASLVPVLRRPNMYPRQQYAERIAKCVVDLFDPESDTTSMELSLDDKDDFKELAPDVDVRVVKEESDVEVDKVLSDKDDKPQPAK